MQPDLPKEGISKPGATPAAIGPKDLLNVKVAAPKGVRSATTWEQERYGCLQDPTNTRALANSEPNYIYHE